LRSNIRALDKAAVRRLQADLAPPEGLSESNARDAGRSEKTGATTAASVLIGIRFLVRA
jgi:hypothetical protein